MTNNICLFSNAFIDPKIKNPMKQIEKLNKGNAIKEFFVVVYNKERNHLEIISSKMFLMEYFRKQEFLVTGMFKSQSDATEYIRCLVDISYKNFNDFNPGFAIENIATSDIQAVFNKEDEK